jgi:hypothetical protein
LVLFGGQHENGDDESAGDEHFDEYALGWGSAWLEKSAINEGQGHLLHVQ